MKKTIHFLYCPFTGLGLYDGYRGDTWLKNRINIFKQFVVRSLTAQTNQNYILWISWRRQEKHNKIVLEFIEWLDIMMCSFVLPVKVVHTFSGVCFYDDKYQDEEARLRLSSSIHGAMQTLVNLTGEYDYVLMTIQPSDDLYYKNFVKDVQSYFENNPEKEAVGFSKGYICNYNTKEVAEYNPKTNPPFYTIKFPCDVFIDPIRHINFTSLKKDVGQYKKGAPLPSHEYVGDCLDYGILNERGFCVGTHGANISTTFSNPYKGEKTSEDILDDFGIKYVPAIKIKIGFWKFILLKLPFKVQRKLRYWFNEKLKL